MDLRSLYDEWRLAVANSASPHTYRAYKSRLERILSGLASLGIKKVEELQKDTGREALYYALPKHSPAVVEQAVAAWENFRKFVEEVKGIPLPSIPKRGLPKKPQTLPKPLSEEELRKLREILESLSDEESWLDAYLAFLLMAYGGLRIGEVLSLTPAHIEGNSIIVKGKGRKERLVELPEKVGQILREFKGRFPLFKERPSREAREKALRRRLNAAAKKAGVANFHPHRLRHTYATRLIEKGVDPFKVRALLGHSSLNTTQKYVGVSRERLREAVKVLEEDF